jgi:hypothetical protein
MNWFCHAFALNPTEPVPGPPGPTDAERPIVDRLCAEVVRRGLTVPALAFLEISRSMNGVAAQTIHFFDPVLSVLGTSDHHRRFAEFLERRDSVAYLCRRIEELERSSSEHGRTPLQGGA